MKEILSLTEEEMKEKQESKLEQLMLYQNNHKPSHLS